ncbi:hypothetical protein [Paraburkholderia sp.]|uniref:hypothetical protein n=1 Tax=Paraburkholderia sp. TaxID=1926495 RepID=UPI002D728C7C|nr:hypothetical protein [Paraburkholderia sp.]HZZ06291.1 hypothetical protein [Paraburkholderia sp.]
MSNHPYKRRGMLGNRKPVTTGFSEHGPDVQVPGYGSGKRLRFALFMAGGRTAGSHDHEATSPDNEARAEYERHETPRPDWKTPGQPLAAAQPVVVTRKWRSSVPELPDSGNGEE